MLNRTRRDFLKTTAAAGSLASLGDLAFLSGMRPLSAEETQLDPRVVQLRPEIEPIVRLLEETPRERLLEEIGQRIQQGLSYREILAALLLAGVRNVQPRPSVGHKFHAVLVVNSAHLASLSSPAEHRWLPIFWALDYFKSSQARDVREGNWTMAPVDESAVPEAHRSKSAFIDAMDNWDESAADAAVAGLARSAGANEIFELFFHYGARDFRSIGHKAIFVANSWRTLQCIGWQHAEPVLRSLAYALLMHEGDNPAKRDAPADRPWRQNAERAAKIRDHWQSGTLDEAATREMLSTLRDGSPDDACEAVVDILNRGVSPQSIWDALFVGSGELLVRQPAIVALHAVTSTNAIRFAWQASGDDETRRMLLLQNAAFLPLFREGMRNRGQVRDFNLEQLPASELSESDGSPLEQVFAEVNRNPMDSASRMYAYLKEGGQATELIDAARVFVFLKGNNSHDYKFSSAVLEDYFHVSPRWRDLYLASSVFKLRGADAPDNQLVQRIRAVVPGA